MESKDPHGAVAHWSHSSTFDDLSPAPQNPLKGVPFLIKENIQCLGLPVRCGSKMLENYRGQYHATCVQILLQLGAKCLGTTHMDEFGMGSSGLKSAFANPTNPLHPGFQVGGSSSGSAVAVASDIVPFSLGSDTGGSVRLPAHYCGVYGLKPTYGCISRYGLVAYASSLDTIGVFSKDLSLMKAVTQALCVLDPKDSTSRPLATHSPIPQPKVGILELDNLTWQQLDPSISEAFEHFQNQLLAQDFRPISVASPGDEIWDRAVAAYYFLACAEASSNLSRFDGIRFGTQAPGTFEQHQTYLTQTRSTYFGPEVKRRILLGTYCLSAGYASQSYNKALEFRNTLHSWAQRQFQSMDFLVLPVHRKPRVHLQDPSLNALEEYRNDRFTVLANLLGYPSLCVPVPCPKGEVSHTGLQIMAKPGFDIPLLDFAMELLAKNILYPPRAYSQGTQTPPPSPTQPNSKGDHP